jgi:hypothetical protein
MRLKCLGLITVLGVAPLANSSAVELAPGDLLSAAAITGDSIISIIRVDPVTGDRVVISGPSGEGGTVIGSGPGIFRNADQDIGLTYADGMIWISTSAATKYLRIDPATGDRMLISGCPTLNATVCRDPVVGSGPLPIGTWALTVVPSDPDPEQIISGCIKSNGTLKIVNDPVECSDRETPISLLGAP